MPIKQEIISQNSRTDWDDKQNRTVSLFISLHTLVYTPTNMHNRKANRCGSPIFYRYKKVNIQIPTYEYVYFLITLTTLPSARTI